MAGENTARPVEGDGEATEQEAIPLSEDAAESLLAVWGEAVSREYAKLGYASMGHEVPHGGGLSAEEMEYWQEHKKLPKSPTPDFYWLPEDLDRCEVAMQWVMVRDRRAVKILQGVHVFDWKRGRGYARALTMFCHEYGQVCLVRDGIYSSL